MPTSTAGVRDGWADNVRSEEVRERPNREIVLSTMQKSGMTIKLAEVEDTRLVYVDEMEGSKPRGRSRKDELINFDVHT